MGSDNVKEKVYNTRNSILGFCNIDEDNQRSLSLNKETLKSVKDSPDMLSYLESVMKTIPEEDNPQTLEQFNYHYVDGKLVNIDTGLPFHWVNQKHYDALGDIIVRHIQLLMVEECDMEEIFLPLEDDDGPKNNIFVSQNVYTCDKIILLIQGSGAVRAGMWARALCINDDINLGSVIPYIKKAHENGYGVIVLNPNLNCNYVPPKNVYRDEFIGLSINDEVYSIQNIKGNENPIKHVLYVWDHFIVPKTTASRFGIVAHSAGGWGAVELIKNRGEAKKKCLG